MSDVRKFKFISPGIFLREVDNSGLPGAAPVVGPVVIGRAKQGPAMRPYTVESFSDFVNTFGEPEAGGVGGDYFREGNTSGPTYGAYAAQAYLDAGVGPVTYIRMLGNEHPEKATGGEAGFATLMDFHSSKGGATLNQDIAENGGSYGLFVFPSGAAGDLGTGSLAAVFYINSGSAIQLSGSGRANVPSVKTSGSAVVIESNSTLEFTAEILNNATSTVHKTRFNFDQHSDKYIRKVFNTDPTLVNSTITDTTLLKKGEETYWLGETYESHLFDTLGATSGVKYGIIMGIGSGSNGVAPMWAERKFNANSAQTSWIFSQDLGAPANYDATDMTKLFRFIARDAGESAHQYKVAISDIRKSTTDFDQYGTFTVEIRKASDADVRPVVVERFSQCNLNPQSPNYIARKIGDRYVEYDYDDARLREYGEFNNQSEIIRVEMNDDIGNMDARLLPFGFFGPPRPPGVTLLSSSHVVEAGITSIQPMIHTDGFDSKVTTNFTGSFKAQYSYVVGSGSISMPYAMGLGATNVASLSGQSAQAGMQSNAQNVILDMTASMTFPAPLTRLSASDHGTGAPTDAYFGLQTHLYDSSRNSTAYDSGYVDYLRGTNTTSGIAFDSLSGPPTGLEYSFVFTLDDVIVPSGKATEAYWMSGSRSGRSTLNTVAAGDSYTGGDGTVGNAAYGRILDKGFNQFALPLYGGTDGFDITDKEPFADYRLTPGGSSATTKNSAVYNTVDRAISTVSDPEFVEMNLLALPGIVNENLTTRAINVCEERGDALAIIDLRGVYTPAAESKDNFKTRVTATTLDGVVTALRDRSLNSSYGATYYPWVQIQDTITGQFLWAPPTVPILGTLASSEKKSEVWFAPAGFNRGGLTGDGAGGLPVVQVTEKLSSKQRDKLYEANVNPIASFPSEGIVVFGQKTLQVTPSALDRINVRRLMIFIKKEVSKISSDILFDQNVQATWDRFLGRVNPLLESVKIRLGLADFKVVLDKTTTTPDLIDRNILYAKIFLQPARASEYIAIDFNITRTGAAFED